MNLEQALAARLEAAATAASSRIYPLSLAEGSALPALSHFRVSTLRDYTHGGASGLARARMQVDCWAATYSAVKGLSAQVRASLSGFSGVLGGAGGAVTGFIFEVGEQDLPEPEAGIYHAVIDFNIGYSE
jgi:hypothetical protein